MNVGRLSIAVTALALGGSTAGAAAVGSSQTLYVSATGSPAASCTQQAPCSTFDRANQLAAPGARVLVAAGSYPSQTVGATSRTGAPVVFEPAPGAKVTITDELNVFGSHLEFRRLKAFDWYVRAGARDVTFRGLDVKLFFVRSATHIQVIGGSVGGIDDGSSPTLGSTYRSTVPARDVLIDHVRFHDVTRASAPGAHVECLFVQSVDGLVVRNSTFRGCDIFDIYVNNIDVGPVPKNVLFENNLLDHATGGGFYSLFVRSDPGDSIDGLVVRYNSFLQGPHFDVGTYTRSRVVSNVSPFAQPQCVPGIVFAHNVFDAARCGPTDRRAALGYVAPDAFRLGLRRGSAGIDAGDPHDAPPRDIRGRARPRGAAPDAGAYENG